jgi:hypothetical protein
MRRLKPSSGLQKPEEEEEKNPLPQYIINLRLMSLLSKPPLNPTLSWI